MKNISVIRLAVAAIFIVSSITTHTNRLKDHNSGGYVDDLSSLPGPEIYHKTSQYSMSAIVKWIDANQMLCAAGLTVTGLVLIYVVNADLRHKINAWLGFGHDEHSDEIHS